MDSSDSPVQDERSLLHRCATWNPCPPNRGKIHESGSRKSRNAYRPRRTRDKSWTAGPLRQTCSDPYAVDEIANDTRSAQRRHGLEYLPGDRAKLPCSIRSAHRATENQVGHADISRCRGQTTWIREAATQAAWEIYYRTFWGAIRHIILHGKSSTRGAGAKGLGGVFR